MTEIVEIWEEFIIYSHKFREGKTRYPERGSSICNGRLNQSKTTGPKKISTEIVEQVGNMVIALGLQQNLVYEAMTGRLD